MSKIEVNTIEPQSGTTLTLGASGDTVALAAGALQSGFGRSGSVLTFGNKESFARRDSADLP